MKTFIFKQKDDGGRILHGFMQAANKKDVKRKVRGANLYFISALPVDPKTIFNSKVSDDALFIFTQRLSSLIEAGVPILKAMNILWRQTDNKTLQLVIYDMNRNLEEGKTIAESLDHFPRMFPLLYRALVTVAERTGGLVEVLNKLTIYLEHQKEIRNKAKKIIMYPVIVFIFAVLVLLGMFAFVVPTFQKVLIKMNVKLPLLTKIVIFISEMLRSWQFWVFGVVLVVALIWTYRHLMKFKKFRFKRDEYKLRIPVIGSLFYTSSMAQFAHSLGVMLGSGVSVIECIEVGKQTTGNLKMIESIGKTQKEVEKGQSLYESFKDNPIFPIMFTEMIGVGESSGKVVKMFENLSKHLDDEVDYRQTKLLTLLEPALIIFVGGIVIVTLLAIYMPIFSIWGGLINM